MTNNANLTIVLIFLALALLSCPLAETRPTGDQHPAEGASEQPAPSEAQAVGHNQGEATQGAPTKAADEAGGKELVDGAERPIASTVALSSELDLKSTIAKICKNKPVPIQSGREMLYLIKEIDRDESRCHDNYMAAIYELEPLLLQPKERYCEALGWALIERYHFRFIQPYRRANRRPTQFEPVPREVVKEQLHPEPRKHTVDFDENDRVLLAPLSIRHFFLKFALQVSHQCKMDLIRNLAKDQGRVLAPGDLEMMAPFSERLFGGDGGEGASQAEGDESGDKQATRRQSIEEAKALALDFDSVLHMPDLDGRIKRENGELLEPTGGEEHKHLHTNAKADSLLYKMIVACQSRFRPMYEKLILPIVRLSKLGYDYQGPMGWSEEERNFLEGALVREWLVAVHVCESFKNTHLVMMDNKNGDNQGDKRSKQTESGAGQLRAALDAIEDEDEPGQQQRQQEGQLETISQTEKDDLAHRGRSLDELLKPVDYKPSERFLMPDQLMIVGVRDLDLELSRKAGHTNPFGFFGWLRRLAGHVKGALAKLDPERFAHYRNNSLWYGSVLNFFSSVTNAASITVTVYTIISMGTG